MNPGLRRFLMVFALSVSLLGWSQNASQSGGDFSRNLHPTEKEKVPQRAIIVKGAWSSASDSVTPLPEGGSVTGNVYSNQYFGITYPLPPDWIEKYKGPPPSDSGRYVLAQITPAIKGSVRGTMLITADDMFFTPLPAANALERIRYEKNNLQDYYKLELQPTETTIAGRSFIFFAYWSPVAELHWYVLATQIRCHTVEIVLTSRDTRLMQNLILGMNKMKLPAEASLTGGTGGGAVPVCMKDYASEEHVIERVEPVFTERRFNPVPVRIIIGKDGRIKHIHFLSAFPEQAKAITDALGQWKFRPYLQDGHPVEVETGIMFGRAPPQALSPAKASTTD